MSEIVKSEPTKMKRVADLDVDEDMIETHVLLPEKYFKKLDATSSMKEMSKGAIVREALKEYFDKQDRPIELPRGTKVSNEVIKNLLRECTTYWGNFEIEGEEGFIAVAKEKGIKLKDLTEPQFEVLAEKLVIGYTGYAFRPTVDEFIGKLSVLEPTEKQKDILRKKLGGEEGEEEEKEVHSEEEWDEDWGDEPEEGSEEEGEEEW